MEKTKHFDELDEKVKLIIDEYGKDETIKRDIYLKEFANRSSIYELGMGNVILKKLSIKGQKDNDISALKDLDGIDYFPKLYAYKNGSYLFMEKAKGIDLVEVIESGVDKATLKQIKELLVDAFSQMITRKRKDWDFKLEHIFWSEEDSKLTWVDLGICDVFNYPHKSIEDEIERFIDMVEDRISMYNPNL